MRTRGRLTLTLILAVALSAVGVVQAQSPAQQVADAESVVSRGERLGSRISAMVSQAQREKDIIRVNCLDDKLAQVNANIRTAKARLQSLKTHTDPQSRMQAMTVMMVLGQKFQVLDQEASQCVGQNVFETGSTLLETEIDTQTVPTDTEVNPAVVPDLIPEAPTSETQTETPPPPEEASGKS